MVQRAEAMRDFEPLAGGVDGCDGSLLKDLRAPARHPFPAARTRSPLHDAPADLPNAHRVHVRPEAGRLRPVAPERELRQKLRNAVHELLLLSAMFGALTVVASIVYGKDAIKWLAVVGLAAVVFRPRVRPAWTLTMFGAVPLPRWAAPQLHEVVATLALRAQLPGPPALFYMPTSVANAFAVGSRDDAVVAVTEGMLRRLPPRQIVAVLAHEIGHVRAGDTTVMALSDVIGRLVHAMSWVGMFGVVLAAPAASHGDARLLVVSATLAALPTAVTLLQLALSRTREFDADLEGAALTGDPEGLAAALETLDRLEGSLWERALGQRRTLPDPLLIRTHPTSAERARRLRELLHPGIRAFTGER
mgnify:CR=1 FL=1